MTDARTATILIVDDDPAVLLTLPPALESETVVVCAASSVAEAERFFAEAIFDAVITDLSLSGTGSCEGLELVSLVKSAAPDTVVVLVTAFGSEGVFEEARRRGADACWLKPMPVGAMIDGLRELGIPLADEGGSD